MFNNDDRYARDRDESRYEERKEREESRRNSNEGKLRDIGMSERDFF